MSLFKKKDAQTKAEDALQSASPSEPRKQAEQATPELGMGNVKYSVAVASGKGGVGKSMVSTNLAIALQMSGKKVGLFDADIYGPSQPKMMGSTDDRVDVSRGYMRPVSKFGISMMSMGLLLDKDSPVIWRAPIAMKMITQFLGSVEWGELDYLIMDLPPGTGDVQLTLAQQAEISGAIIVTTPQEVALGVARKGVAMFQRVNIPILGVVENMSGFTCSHCNEVTDIFNSGGGEKLATETGVNFLGRLPLDPSIMSSGDRGVPLLIESKDSPASLAFVKLAETIHNLVEKTEQEISAIEPRDVKLDRQGYLVISWPDDHIGKHTPHYLRLNCNCAECVSELSGRPMLDPKKVPLDVRMTAIRPVGRYGIALAFSDGHNTGMYTFHKLREMCECDTCSQGKIDQKSFTI